MLVEGKMQEAGVSERLFATLMLIISYLKIDEKSFCRYELNEPHSAHNAHYFFENISLFDVKKDVNTTSVIEPIVDLKIDPICEYCAEIKTTA